MTVDRTLTPSVMVTLAKRFRSLDPASIKMLTLDSDVKFVTIQGQDVLLPVPPAVQGTVQQFLSVGTTPATSGQTASSSTSVAPATTTTTTRPALAC